MDLGDLIHQVSQGLVIPDPLPDLCFELAGHIQLVCLSRLDQYQVQTPVPVAARASAVGLPADPLAVDQRPADQPVAGADLGQLGSPQTFLRAHGPPRDLGAAT